MKKINRLFSFLIVLVVAITAVACGDVTPKTFSDSGISITLDSSFEKKTVEGRTLCYSNKDESVFVTKEPFSAFAGTSISQYSSLLEYTELVLENNRLSAQITERDSYIFFEYEREVETEAFCFSKKQKVSYLAVTYKSGSAFWLVQFACKSDDYDQTKDRFFGYADSVTFN